MPDPKCTRRGVVACYCQIPQFTKNPWFHKQKPPGKKSNKIFFWARSAETLSFTARLLLAGPCWGGGGSIAASQYLASEISSGPLEGGVASRAGWWTLVSNFFPVTGQKR